MRFSRLRSFGTVAVVMTIIPPHSAFAWGHVGHAVVADIAQAHLTPAATVTINRLLATDGAHRLSDISSWADEVKGEDLPNRPAHTIRLPLAGDPTPPHPCPSHFCADDGITFWSAVLADPNRSDRDRETALKYIVHLVGDLQQPLHDVDATGSDLKVVFEGKETQLHKVWDDGILESNAGKDPSRIAIELMQSEADVPSGGDPADWAEEGRLIAQTKIYKTISPHTANEITLPPGYAREMWPVVKLRLTEGGLRLARLLNQLLT